MRTRKNVIKHCPNRLQSYYFFFLQISSSRWHQTRVFAAGDTGAFHFSRLSALLSLSLVNSLHLYSFSTSSVSPYPSVRRFLGRPLCLLPVGRRSTAARVEIQSNSSENHVSLQLLCFSNHNERHLFCRSVDKNTVLFNAAIFFDLYVNCAFTVLHTIKILIY